MCPGIMGTSDRKMDFGYPQNQSSGNDNQAVNTTNIDNDPALVWDDKFHLNMVIVKPVLPYDIKTND
jgi:hypothetical protein